MRIFIQFSIIFTEILLAIFEFAGGALLLREYWRRKKQWHLFFMAVSFLVAGIANALSFIGDLLNSYGLVSAGETLTEIYALGVLISAVFYAFVFIRLYCRRLRRPLYLMVGLVALLSSAMMNLEVMSAFGQLLPVNTVSGFIWSYGFWIAVHLVTAIAVYTVYKRKRRADDKTYKPDRLLMLGSLNVLLVATLVILLLNSMHLAGTGVIYLFLIMGTILKYLGTLAKNHDNQEVVQHPIRLISSSLTMKIVLVSGAAYTVFIIVMMSSVTHYFVSYSMNNQYLNIRGAVSNTAQNYAQKKQLLIDASEVITTHGEWGLALKGNSVEVDRLINDLGRSYTMYNVYLVNNDGRLVYSFNDQSEINQLGLDSSIIRLALAGQNPAVTTEFLPGEQTWVNLVARPIIDSNNRIQGVLVASSLIENQDIPICFNQKTHISGCGFISEEGEVVFSSGEKIDVQTTDKFMRAIGFGADKAEGQSEKFSKYFVESVDVSQGGGGFYYAFVNQEDADRELSQFISTMVLITGVFSLLFFCLLIFSLYLFLQPLLMLKVGAERLARGDYDYRINYDSSDEIGQLTKSFNTMSDTIRQRTEKLNQKMNEQRDLFSNIAHEIRTPLNIFRWSLEMLRFGDTGPLNNEQMELLENMNQTNDRMRKLVTDLLDVARLQTGHIKLEPAPLHLGGLIDDVAGNFSVRMREKNIDFYWKHPENSLPQVRGDRQRLSQVLTNILGNAVKFTDDGGHIGITLQRVDEQGRLSDQGKFLMVSVEDNGRGIPKKEQQIIFRRFYRASNATEDGTEGTGLGMFLSKEYVEMHGGRIWFQSKEGSGTTFYFTIPIVKD